jgi:hypothetical protein
MAEVVTQDGTWTFDGENIRIVPGRDRGVHKLRQAVGEVAVPLTALAGIAYEPGRKSGRLRLRLRDGADPFTQAARGQLPSAADPYQLTVGTDRTGVAEYLVDEVRNALLIEQVPDGPSDRYLLPGPRVPLTASAGDGSAAFDGTRIHLEWNAWTDDGKKSAGPQNLLLKDLAAVEWKPLVGFENGHLRFRLEGAATSPQPKHDPHCLTWGIRELGGTTLLVAAAVVARLLHPSGAPAPDVPGESEAAAPAVAGADPDAILRRLRELGDLHSDGVLTDEEFTAAKRILLRDS